MAFRDMSNYGKLIFHNRASTDFGIMINYPLPDVHAVPDITANHVPGRSGDVLIDNNDSYQNINLVVSVTVERPQGYDTWFELETAISQWLKGSDYSYLKFDNYPGYVWEAVVMTPPNLKPNVQDDLQEIGTLTFNCKPNFKRIDGIKYQPLPKTGVVRNTENMSAWPDWHLVGSGDFILTVNGFPYELNNISSEIWIDGANALAYQDSTTLLNGNIGWANNDAPELIVGKNTINLAPQSGATLEKIEYKPNWRRLI